MHKSGYLYCDIKLNNIVVGDCIELNRHSTNHLHKLRFIDYGLSRRYLDDHGKHVPKIRERVFKGNVVFASKNLFNLDTPGRRDDFISLSYLLLYTIDGDLPFIMEQEE